jgi:hypothetical protein
MEDGKERLPLVYGLYLGGIRLPTPLATSLRFCAPGEVEANRTA